MWHGCHRWFESWLAPPMAWWVEKEETLKKCAGYSSLKMMETDRQAHACRDGDGDGRGQEEHARPSTWGDTAPRPLQTMAVCYLWNGLQIKPFSLPLDLCALRIDEVVLQEEPLWAPAENCYLFQFESASQTMTAFPPPELNSEEFWNIGWWLFFSRKSLKIRQNKALISLNLLPLLRKWIHE